MDNKSNGMNYIKQYKTTLITEVTLSLDAYSGISSGLVAQERVSRGYSVGQYQVAGMDFVEGKD
ncbi:MAG TPA: hypothetical protein VIX90_06410 [Edaphobacter sp.]